MLLPNYKDNPKGAVLRAQKVACFQAVKRAQRGWVRVFPQLATGSQFSVIYLLSFLAGAARAGLTAPALTLLSLRLACPKLVPRPFGPLPEVVLYCRSAVALFNLKFFPIPTSRVEDDQNSAQPQPQPQNSTSCPFPSITFVATCPVPVLLTDDRRRHPETLARSPCLCTCYDIFRGLLVAYLWR